MNHLLSRPILASILILGVFAIGLSFDDAEAKKTQGPINVGDQFQIKTKKGIATCIDQGELCGKGELSAKFLLITTEIEGDIIKGNAKGVIQGSGWGWLVSESSSSTKTELRNDDSLSFEYDTLGRILTMSGVILDETGFSYEYDVVGNVAEFKKDKAKINLTMKLVAENGIVIDVTGAGIIGFAAVKPAEF